MDSCGHVSKFHIVEFVEHLNVLWCESLHNAAISVNTCCQKSVFRSSSKQWYHCCI